MLQDDLARLREIENSLAIFCVATYGEGDPTDNAQELYDWLKDGNSSLEDLNYAVSLSLRLRLSLALTLSSHLLSKYSVNLLSV